jgi:cobalt-zinc-cadmium efflux system membrane fusion protein
VTQAGLKVCAAVIVTLSLAAHEGHGDAVTPRYQTVERSGQAFMVGLACVPAAPVVGEDVQCEFRATRVGAAADAPALTPAEVRLRAREEGGDAGLTLEPHGESTPGVYGVHHRFTGAGSYDLTVAWTADGGRIEGRLPVQVTGGPMQSARVVFGLAAAAGVLLLGAVAWFLFPPRASEEDAERRLKRRRGVMLAVAAVAIIWIVDRTLAPRVGAAFLPERPEMAVDWTPDHVPAATTGSVQPAAAVSQLVEPHALTVIGAVRVKPELQARVFAPIWGRIEFAKRPLSVGDRVEKGEPLVNVILELSANERHLMLVRAQDIKTALEQARTRRAQADWQLKRAIEMVKTYPDDAYWKQEVQLTERIAKGAADEENLLTQQTKSYEGTMQRRDPRITPVEAPISGLITNLAFTPGQLNPTDEFLELCTITDLSTVWIEADVFESDLGTVLGATRARFQPVGSDIDRQLSRPVAVAGAVDEHRRVKVIYETANPRGDLKLGMSVRVRFDLTEKQP